MAFKRACFSKNRQASGGFAPRPSKPLAIGDSAPRPPSMMRLSYTSLLAHVSHFGNFHLLILVNHTTSSGLPFYDIFVPQKNLLSKISDDVIACNFGFGLSSIKNSGYAYAASAAVERLSSMGKDI